MASINLPERQINAGTKWTSPSISCPTAVRNVFINLIVNSTEYDTKTGIFDCGVEISTDNGLTWTHLAGIANAEIGWRNAKGGTHEFGMSAESIVGKLARVFIKPSIRIRLSISGSIY